MKALATIFALVFFLDVSCTRAGESYPLQDPKDGEGRPSWWWDLFYNSVVVVRGSLNETEKERPDLTMQGTYAAWSKLTAPSLANQPTERGFYLLLTRLKVAEILYVDKTLLHVDAKINGLIQGKIQEVDCLLPANLKQVGEPDADGHYTFTYQLNLPGGEFVGPQILPKKEVVLVLQYSNLYPLDGLYLTSAVEMKDLVVFRLLLLAVGWRGCGW